LADEGVKGFSFNGERSIWNKQITSFSPMENNSKLSIAASHSNIVCI